MNLRACLYKALCLAWVAVGSGLHLEAQTDIQKYYATAENGYGIVYTLPRTEIEVSAIVLERTMTPGELYPWAVKYLGTEPINTARREYELAGVAMRLVGVPDTTRQYLIAFDRRSVAPFVRLAPGNLLYSINGSQEPSPTPTGLTLPPPVVPDRTMPTLPRDYSLATTAARRAEVAAAYIFDLREHLLGVVSGEAEQMPRDGEAMRLALAHLRTEEARTTRLFLGDTTTVARLYTGRIVPEEGMTGHTVFRFSPEWGIVDADDLSGDPIQLDLSVIERAPALDDKEQKKRDKMEGFAYNLPGTADIRLRLNGRVLVTERLPLTQLGTIQYLAKRMLNLKEGATTAIYFDPTTGALSRVTNE